MKSGTIRPGDFEPNAAPFQSSTSHGGYVSGAGSDLQKRERGYSQALSNTPDQGFCRPHSAEATVEEFQIFEGRRNFGWCAGIAVKQLGGGNTFHLGGRSDYDIIHPESLTSGGMCIARSIVCGFAIWDPVVGESAVLKLPPALLPATACYRDRCSTRLRREAPRASPVRQCGRRGARRCDPHCARSRLGVK
jgi:hypothetical protein